MRELRKKLTRGQLAQLSGTSVKALRYYEKLGILIPDYINEENGYRYYNSDKLDLVFVITLFVEMNIPLNKFKEFQCVNGDLNLKNLIDYSKQITEKKLKELQSAVEFFDMVERDMQTVTQFQTDNKKYYKKFEEKVYFIMRCDKLDDEFLMRMIEEADKIFDYDFESTKAIVSAEAGVLHICKNGKVDVYAFFEFPKEYKGHEKTILVPKGKYICNIIDKFHLDENEEIFTEDFTLKEDKIVIQSDIFSNETNIYNLMKEIRTFSL